MITIPKFSNSDNTGDCAATVLLLIFIFSVLHCWKHNNLDIFSEIWHCIPSTSLGMGWKNIKLPLTIKVFIWPLFWKTGHSLILISSKCYKT